MTAPIAFAALVIGAAVVLTRLALGHAMGRRVPGGMLIGDPGGYDTHSRILFGSLYRQMARDVAAAASPGARILEVGCGPGHLSTRLARDQALEVTGLDLDPAMIERARANAARSEIQGRAPRFVEGDVASLPFDDSSFDLVVSTFSMHHWSDPTAGLSEIARVLRPGGRVLLWDLTAGLRLPFHPRAPDPAEHVGASPLRLVSVTPWRWPWRLSFSQRWELAR